MENVAANEPRKLSFRKSRNPKYDWRVYDGDASRSNVNSIGYVQSVEFPTANGGTFKAWNAYTLTGTLISNNHLMRSEAAEAIRSYRSSTNHSLNRQVGSRTNE